MKLDLVDVFGSAPLKGNPLAVVRGCEHLSGDAMQALADWLGFSETTFLLEPENPAADYRVRIFCPGRELPFAGHPTLGTCHSWLVAGGQARDPDCIVQECGVGLVPVRRNSEQLAFRAPALTRSGPLSEEELKEALRISGAARDSVVEAVHVANGPNWQLIRLRSANDVLAAEPAARAVMGIDIGLAGPWEQGQPADWEVRTMFANQNGQVVEDPVTGSFNAGVAMHLFSNGLAQDHFVAAQGRKVGADGRIFCSQDSDGSVWIGGETDLVAQDAALPDF